MCNFKAKNMLLHAPTDVTLLSELTCVFARTWLVRGNPQLYKSEKHIEGKTLSEICVCAGISDRDLSASW